MKFAGVRCAAQSGVVEMPVRVACGIGTRSRRSPRLAVGLWALVLALTWSAANTRAQRQMEKLGRGLVVVRHTSSQAYLSWRLLVTDAADIGFNVYRSANRTAGVKLNAAVITNTTDFTDSTASFSVSNAWYVVPVINGVEQSPSPSYGLAANFPIRQYLSIPLQPVTGGAYPPYDVKFAWVGDFDGDGEYDYVVDRLSTTTAANQYLQAYKRDGTFLWQMDMGYNSTNQYSHEPGASAISIGMGDCVTVYDMDGDGRAEVLVRTARGVTVTNAAGAQMAAITAASDLVQYMTVLDGLTGAVRASAVIPNPYASQGPIYGHMGIMYCDGIHPSVLYEGWNRNNSSGGDLHFNLTLTTWDFREDALVQRFWWERGYNAMGEGHQIRIADVDHDGKDEFCEIGFTVDDDGTTLFNTELGHGDRFHLSDLDPDRPGLETFAIQQENPSLLTTALYDSGTGQFIKKWYSSGIVDVGRGTTLDLTPATRGSEVCSTQPGIFDCKGNQIYPNTIWPPEALWWDGDVLREFEDGAGSGAYSPVVNKFNPATGNTDRLYTLYNEDGGCHQAYGGRAAVWGDLFGDWREEFMVVANDYNSVRIYTTRVPATNRVYCLMQNPAYRCQATCRGYYQASYLDYYLGNDMPAIPIPPVSDAALVWRGNAGSVWDENTTASWFTNNLWISNTVPATFTSGASVLFDLTGSNRTALAITGTLTPGDVRVHSPKDYTFDSSAGNLSGAMKLTKAGAGSLTLNGMNTYTGATLVGEGALVVNGSLPHSPVTVRGGVWHDGRLGGTGVVGSAVRFEEAAGVSPGAGTNSPGTLTLAGNVTFAGRTRSDFDLSDDPTGTIKTNDRVVINGNLTLQGTNTLVIRKLNATLPPGVYPLISYAGSLVGSLSNLAVSGLPGVPLALTNPPGQIALLVRSHRAPATLNWTGGSGGNVWDVLGATNFLNGATKDQFVPGDTVRFDNIGTSNLTANLSGDLSAAAVIVDSTANYTLAGSGGLIGSANLIKSNAGTLTITALNNAYTGKTSIAGGTIVVSELDAVGFPSPLGNPPGGSIHLVLYGGSTLRVTGESYTDRGMTLNAGQNTLDVFNVADQVTIAGQIVGSGALVKAGAGTLALNVANTFSGGVIISNGIVALGSAAGNQTGVGTGAVTIYNGRLSMMDIQASETAAWPLIVPAGATARLDCDGRCTLTGALTGGGTLTVFTPYVRTDFNGNWSGFAGQINFITDSDGGDFRINNASGYANAAIDLAAKVNLYSIVSGPPTIDIGALSGAAGSFIIPSAKASGSTPTSFTLRVGARNADTTFAGNIGAGATVSLLKLGAGTWTLSGTNSYTGTTTVSTGALLVNGGNTAATGAVTVNASATLGGTGTLGGATTVNGTLSPGVNGIGTLTFTNNLAVTSSGTVAVQINKTAGISDLVTCAARLTFGGTLQVTNLSGTLGSGDSFKLFNAASYGGSFSTMQLPALSTGLGWNTSQLLTDGRLWVMRTNPPTLAMFACDGANLTLSGGGGTPGWPCYLLAATNPALPMTHWTRVAANTFAPDGNVSFTLPVESNCPARFYRLQTP